VRCQTHLGEWAEALNVEQIIERILSTHKKTERINALAEFEPAPPPAHVMELPHVHVAVAVGNVDSSLPHDTPTPSRFFDHGKLLCSATLHVVHYSVANTALCCRNDKRDMTWRAWCVHVRSVRVCALCVRCVCARVCCVCVCLCDWCVCVCVCVLCVRVVRVVGGV
jgi:hypothetical protein